jgi:hypothetical protein
MRLSDSHRRLLALATFVFLTGCSANGDFGEVKPMLVRDDIHDWEAEQAIAGTPGAPSKFLLTDDERSLRDLAYPLIEPPYERQRWDQIAGEYGIFRPPVPMAREAYASHLSSDSYRSPSARYQQLTDDISDDTIRLPQFFETAGRVLDMDAKRRKSLRYISTPTEAERANVIRRIEENARIVAMVRTSLSGRVAAYRFTLERLVIAVPSPQAVEAERALNQLKAQIARYRSNLPPTWQREQSLAAAD